jgi:5-methylcytosine-specific restriction enzyme A
MAGFEDVTWGWVEAMRLDEDGGYGVTENFAPPLTTPIGRAVWLAARGADREIVETVRDPEGADLATMNRRRAQMEVMVGLFSLYAEMGIDHPQAAGEVLAAIVADAAQVARLYRWEATRGSISGRVRTLVYRRDGYACVECGADDVTQLTVDHRIPVALGGGDDPSNLRTLCKPCNSRKGTRL